ncbi:endonuclease III [bacterium]|nr:endonuclease III [bacterium]
MRKRALLVLRSLKRAYPDAHIPLVFSSPHELLVATILSAQCTDARVNEVTPALFRKYNTAADWAAADLATLEKAVHPTGFFRNKAKAIKASARDIVEKHGGEVPRTIEELTALRGIGRKSANVLISHAFGGQGIIVDTHFRRITRRLGLTAEHDPVRIESDLGKIVPRRRWADFSLYVNWHGRVTCFARKPHCDACPTMKNCPARESHGEITWLVKNAGAR